jgi:Nif-specific regulatory protein
MLCDKIVVGLYWNNNFVEMSTRRSTKQLRDKPASQRDPGEHPEIWLDADVDLRSSLSERYDFLQIVGNSGLMRQVYEQIAQVAPTTATVLIQGESGTGKELVANALHINSPRSRKPFIKVNCGALSETLIEMELFGQERGAFTDAFRRKPGRFELASGGTLFLDEIGELPLVAQAKLLRVLQTREFERIGGTETIKADVRLVAATNRRLEKEVAAGRFREDLYYRLNVFNITVPALRERRDDIEPLAEYFLDKHASQNRKSIRRFSAYAMNLLNNYGWPGNVRELENVIERAVVVCDGALIHHYHLSPELQTSRSAINGDGLFAAVAAFERELICDALKNSSGHRKHAARFLKISERVLNYKIQKYKIRCESFRD